MGFASLKKTKKRIVCQESKPVAGVDVLTFSILGWDPIRIMGSLKLVIWRSQNPAIHSQTRGSGGSNDSWGRVFFFCGQITSHVSHLSIQYLQLSRLNTLCGKTCISDIYVSRSQAPNLKRHPGKQSGDSATSRPMPPACRISLRK